MRRLFCCPAGVPTLGSGSNEDARERIMSFLKRLFGGGDKPVPQAQAADPVEYKGFMLVAAPMAEGGQFRVAGTVSKDFGGEAKTHRFIRADVFTDRDEAVAATMRKAQLIVDQNGERLF
jgi:hypothetical protein